MPCLQADGGEERAFLVSVSSFLVSVSYLWLEIILMPNKWPILGWHILLPLNFILFIPSYMHSVTNRQIKNISFSYITYVNSSLLVLLLFSQGILWVMTLMDWFLMIYFLPKHSMGNLKHGQDFVFVEKKKKPLNQRLPKYKLLTFLINIFLQVSIFIRGQYFQFYTEADFWIFFSLTTVACRKVP